MCAAGNGRADATCALLIAGAAEGIKDKQGYGVARRTNRASRGGTAPADVPCRRTAEDYAKASGKAAAYADAVQRVRPPARAGAAVRASAREARVRACGVEVGACCLGVCAVLRVCVCVCCTCLCACLRVRAGVCACARVWSRVRLHATPRCTHRARF